MGYFRHVEGKLGFLLRDNLDDNGCVVQIGSCWIHMGEGVDFSWLYSSFQLFFSSRRKAANEEGWWVNREGSRTSLLFILPQCSSLNALCFIHWEHNSYIWIWCLALGLHSTRNSSQTWHPVECTYDTSPYTRTHFYLQVLWPGTWFVRKPQMIPKFSCTSLTEEDLNGWICMAKSTDAGPFW